ncbi:hypothetical protein BH10CYA1_BH10CYA1_11300 [soil metagenome]
MENQLLDRQIDAIHLDLAKIPEYQADDAELVKSGKDLMDVFHFLKVERQNHRKHEDVSPQVLNLAN